MDEDLLEGAIPVVFHFPATRVDQEVVATDGRFTYHDGNEAYMCLTPHHGGYVAILIYLENASPIANDMQAHAMRLWHEKSKVFFPILFNALKLAGIPVCFDPSAADEIVIEYLLNEAGEQLSEPELLLPGDENTTAIPEHHSAEDLADIIQDRGEQIAC